MIHSSTHNKTSLHYYQHGLSLLELTIVLLILMALASLTLPSFTEVPRYAQCTATKATMKAIRDALLGNIDGPGYLADMGGIPIVLPLTIKDLFTNPVHLNPFYCITDTSYLTEAACTGAGETWGQDKFNPHIGMGWRGPYLQESTTLTVANLGSGNFENPTTVANSHINPYLATGDLAVLDSFSHGSSVRRPIIVQNPPLTGTNDCISTNISGVSDPNDCIRLVSAGSNGVLDTPLSDAKVTAATRVDDVILYLRISDPVFILPANDQTGCELTD